VDKITIFPRFFAQICFFLLLVVDVETVVVIAVFTDVAVVATTTVINVFTVDINFALVAAVFIVVFTITAVVFEVVAAVVQSIVVLFLPKFSCFCIYLSKISVACQTSTFTFELFLW